jgi:hypothetical protein
LIKMGWDARALAGGYDSWRQRYPVAEIADVETVA